MVWKHLFALLIGTFSLLFAFAQRSDASNKITIKGYSKTQTIHCDGENVVILDDYHKITITGHCTTITVYGNKSVIKLESVRLISIHGNDNKISYKVQAAFKTKVSRYGDDNRVTKIE